MAYNNLFGVQINTNDGGLDVAAVPQAKGVVIVGTAGKGVVDQLYTVKDLASAASEFGFQGSLVSALLSVSQGGCDNIQLFRMGTTPAVLSGVGRVEHPAGTLKSANDIGYTITFGQQTADLTSRYQVHYDGAGALQIFLDGNLVYDNNAAAPVDTGDCDVTGIAVGGAKIESGVTTSNWTKSLPLSNAAIAAATDFTVVDAGPTKDDVNKACSLSLGKTGLGMTDPCDVYEALLLALQNLSIGTMDVVFAPDAVFDTPNVAFYVPSDPSTALNNPAGGAALGWLNTTFDAYGSPIFRWAHKTKDSSGATVAAMTFTSGADRLSKDFHEVSFPYMLGRFCEIQTQNQNACSAFLGVRGPVSFGMKDIRNWIGYLPKTDPATGFPSSAGSGLCGFPYLTGTVSSKLNPYCADIATKAYRASGLFLTLSAADANQPGEYDESVVVDGNGYPTDIGKYLHVVGDWGYVANSASTGAPVNLAGVVCGLYSTLDANQSLTNKSLPGVTQAYRINLGQVDSLTAAKVNVLKFKGDNVAPTLIHDKTAATNSSDFIYMVRMSTHFLVIDELRKTLDPFIGQASTDSSQFASMRTALTNKFMTLSKRGYLSAPNFQLYMSPANKKIGRVSLSFTYKTPDLATQIRATVAIGS